MGPIRRALIAAALAALLAGCKPPPVPDDHFYRFGRVPDGQVFADPVIGGKLLVELPLAAGIRRERAILYSDDPGHVMLRRYHYHLWEDQPPRLIQRRLVDRIMQAGAARSVTDQLAEDTTHRLRVRIERFEREMSAGQAHASIALRFQLIPGHRQAAPLFDETYSERVAAASGEMAATADAFTRGLDRVIDRFLVDLSTRVAP